MESVKIALARTVEHLFSEVPEIEVTRPEAAFGDFTTNVAMKLAKREGQNPREIAQKIINSLLANKPEWLTDASVAGPGFINLTVTDTLLANQWSLDVPQFYANKKVIAEYSDPNPFKALHAGHLYTTLVGNSIAQLLEKAGGTVYRLNYGGDVGLHVARAMFGIISFLGGEYPDKLEIISPSDRSNWISQRYVEGTEAYETNDTNKQAIIDLNKKIYDIHENNDTTSSFAQIYWICRQWSYDGFAHLYEDLSVTPFTEFIPESKVTPLGLSLVEEGLKTGVFERSEGAIVFDGDKIGLHTRVFINSNGLPVYETKELGLASYKWQQYHFDKSVVITGNDIIEYMKVMLAAIAMIEPEISDRTVHLTHGMIRLADGKKMSSRKGNVLMADDIISAARKANTELSGNTDDGVAIGAIKYAFLRQRLGGDIIYDPQESISLQGNSGPYLQYAHARARSILQKAQTQSTVDFSKLTDHERLLVSALADYQSVLAKAITDLMPHHICTYLYELAQAFNRFYENSRVIGDERESVRLVLVNRYADTLKAGLGLLGIAAPDKI